MSADFPLVMAVFLIGFVALWVVVAVVLGLIGGWRELARRYRSQLPFSGHKWYFRSATMNIFVRYNRMLTVGVNPAGLYLAVMALFRPGHPPLFIPWHDITMTSEQKFAATFIVFKFSGAPGVTLRMRERFGREMLETARGGASPIQ